VLGAPVLMSTMGDLLISTAVAVVAVADMNVSVSRAGVDVCWAVREVVALALALAELMSGADLVSVLVRTSVIARVVLVLSGNMV